MSVISRISVLYKAKATAWEHMSKTHTWKCLPVEQQQRQEWHVLRESELLAVGFWKRTFTAQHIFRHKLNVRAWIQGMDTRKQPLLTASSWSQCAFFRFQPVMWKSSSACALHRSLPVAAKRHSLHLPVHSTDGIVEKKVQPCTVLPLHLWGSRQSSKALKRCWGWPEPSGTGGYTCCTMKTVQN